MIRWTTAIAIALLLTTVAAAQPTDPAETAYQEGRRHYDLREWDKAIERFKEAYRLRPEERSLFNIAQSYRLKGDCVEATSFYKTFKRNYPAAKNIKTVDGFIASLAECVKNPPAKTEPVLVKTEPAPVKTEPAPVKTEPAPVKTDLPRHEPPPPPAPAPPPPSRPGRGMRIAGLSVGGAGVLVTGVGVYFGLRARSLASEAEDLTGTWDPSIESRGEKAQRSAYIAWGVGGAAIIGGVVLYMMGRSSGEQPSVGLAPRSDGAMVVWECDL
jgi:hypothetical protein